MTSRIIKSTARHSSVQLTDCIASLLALEILSPGGDLYVVSPWISDILILNNAHGQFRGILPDLLEGGIRLSTLLNTLAERSTQVRVLCRPNEKANARFIAMLNGHVQLRHRSALHEKVMVCQHFYLRGSMNFTYTGLQVNDENTEITTDSGLVGQALLEAEKLWNQTEPLS